MRRLCILAGLLSLLLTVRVSAASPTALDEMIWSGQMDNAIRVLNVRLQQSPNDAQAYHLLSKAYFHLKKWDQAIENGEQAVLLAPNNSDYWMWLGRAYGEKANDANFLSAMGLAKKVHSSFEKAVNLDQHNVAAMTDLGEFYVEAPGIVGGGTDKAQRLAQRLISIDPGKAHWIYAIIDQKNKDFASAEREYKAAIQASGNDGVYWLNLGNMYRGMQRWNDMDTAIQNGLASNKKPPAIYYNAATIYYHANRDLPKAVDLLRKYISLNSANDEAPMFQAHYMLGQVLEKEGNTQAAAREYQIALNLANNYGPASQALKKISDHN